MIKCTVLYEHWRAWCQQQGRDHPGTVQTFGNDLHSAMPELRVVQPREENRQRHYQGIRLRTADDPVDPA